MREIDTSSPYVIAFGEVLWDCLPDQKVLGGAPANFTYRLQSLGTPCFLVSKVGNDALGREALCELKARGLDTEAIQTDMGAPTGTVPITINHRGNAEYTIPRGVAYDRIDLTRELLNLARGASALCFGSLAVREEHSRATLRGMLAAAPDALKVIDINLRHESWDSISLTELIEQADILKLNDEEAETLWSIWEPGRAFSFTLFSRYVIDRFSLDACVITRSSRGVHASSASGECVNLPGIPVTVVDTIGAGDAFTAAFVSGLLAGGPLVSCCQRGNELGALVASTKGGMTEISSIDYTRPAGVVSAG